jgi:hypothetical protein
MGPVFKLRVKEKQLICCQFLEFFWLFQAIRNFLILGSGLVCNGKSVSPIQGTNYDTPTLNCLGKARSLETWEDIRVEAQFQLTWLSGYPVN